MNRSFGKVTHTKALGANESELEEKIAQKILSENKLSSRMESLRPPKILLYVKIDSDKGKRGNI